MYCLIYEPDQNHYLEFKNPVSLYETREITQVLDYLNQVLERSDSCNHIVGFLAYEASPAFDEAFVAHDADILPLLCFGVFDSFEIITLADINEQASFDPWEPSIQQDTYRESIRKIKHHITEGDTYQVNYTFKLNSLLKEDPKQMFFKVQNQVRAEYAAYIELDSQVICSFSPELFFTWDQGLLISKPMKGTAPRGLTLEEDKKNCFDLANCHKNQAENIMIVDMIRNDMGRVANTGSVKVTNRFTVEKYPYVLQMTSTVTSKADVPLVRVFEALFPCASITGAPKFSTMKIIKNLEPEPRGVYTGTIGYVSSAGKARFNVAIRTLVVDKKTGKTDYGVGGGIVWDSETDSEYEECLLKSQFLQRREPRFKLIESLLWNKKEGYYLLENHLDRLADSAEYFDFPFSEKSIRDALDTFQENIPLSAAKTRLLLNKNGESELEWSSLDGVKSTDLKVGLAKDSIDSQNRFLYHKTTNRLVYEQARKSRPECDDVILWNEKGEITESCRSNVVVEIGGELITPPVQCGLLAGTFRSHLLKKGEIREGILSLADFNKARRIFTINSVRRWMDVELI